MKTKVKTVAAKPTKTSSLQAAFSESEESEDEGRQIKSRKEKL